MDAPNLRTIINKEDVAKLELYRKPSTNLDDVRLKATICLFSELLKGEQSAKENGWQSFDEVESSLAIK